MCCFASFGLRKESRTFYRWCWPLEPLYQKDSSDFQVSPGLLAQKATMKHQFSCRIAVVFIIAVTAIQHLYTVCAIHVNHFKQSFPSAIRTYIIRQRAASTVIFDTAGNVFQILCFQFFMLLFSFSDQKYLSAYGYFSVHFFIRMKSVSWPLWQKKLQINITISLITVYQTNCKSKSRGIISVNLQIIAS